MSSGLEESLIDLVVPDVELVGRRNRQLELLPVADHVEGLVAHDGIEANHAQHVGLAHQDVAPNLLEVRDLASLFAPHLGVDVDRCIQRLDLARVVVEAVNQLLLSGCLKLGVAQAHLDRPGVEQTTGSS